MTDHLGRPRQLRGAICGLIRIIGDSLGDSLKEVAERRRIAPRLGGWATMVAIVGMATMVTTARSRRARRTVRRVTDGGHSLMTRFAVAKMCNARPMTTCCNAHGLQLRPSEEENGIIFRSYTPVDADADGVYENYTMSFRVVENIPEDKPGSPIRRLLSKGKTPPLHTFCVFLPRYVAWHPHSRLAVSDASVSSVLSVAVAPWRRTRHPSGSRLVEVSFLDQTSAPGTPVPQKTSRTIRSLFKWRLYASTPSQSRLGNRSIKQAMSRSEPVARSRLPDAIP